ncbi:DUF4249 domain-containing protein [Hymenobacter aerophilus]|uniref:DUF4249 domain-containing protein n=1 Tax=Hymenobacter aerophilus TaxID=119644 RepID=UPI001F0AC663|nr:DUF4249 domain-containing protein [Hymenobacter aerophilus]
MLSLTVSSKAPSRYRMQQLLALILLLLAGLAGCVEPYAPEVINAPPNLLVVEGFINADGPTSIRLSRTAALAAKVTPALETKARLLIELQNGPSYALSETAPGTYTGAPLNLPAGSLCRLRISTAKGQQYASDFVPVSCAPPIDELQWKAQESGFNFYLSTQDPTGSSQFYRWEYDETWEIIPVYRPDIQYYTIGPGKGRLGEISSPYPYPAKCWGNEQSPKIVLNQTAGLSQDQVRDFRLRVLPLNSNRLFSRYSLHVRQQALTREEYDYWQLLAKNTENIGTLFDAQPSQLTGNVRNLDEAGGGQPALGFVGAHSVSEKRIFVDRTELPAGTVPLTGYEDCMPPDLTNPYAGDPPPTPDEIAAILFGAFDDPSYVPITRVPGQGLWSTSVDCVDCRARGTAIRPSFW